MKEAMRKEIVFRLPSHKQRMDAGPGWKPPSLLFLDSGHNLVIAAGKTDVIDSIRKVKKATS